MARWHIIHRQHDGTNDFQVSPENLNVTWNKGENGPHELTYEIPIGTDTDLTKVQPYIQDFALCRNDIEIMHGMITSVGFESEQDYLSVAAKSYLHYLDRRFYPFDPLHPNQYRIGNPPAGLAMEFHDNEISVIIDVLLTKVFSMPNSLDMTWELVNTGIHTDFQIDLADFESILSKIQGLSSQDPGLFDFWMDNKVFKMAYPRRYDIDVLGDATLCQWTFVESDSGLLNVKLTNTGPEGTHLIGVGSGDDVRYGLDDPGMQNAYRLMDANIDFGDVTSRARVNAMTQAAFPRFTNPHFEVVIEVWPDAVKDFFYGTIYPGCAIWLDYQFDTYRIRSAFEVVSMELELTDDSDESVTLNLNQVYPAYQESAPPVTVDPGFNIPMPPRYTYTPPTPVPVPGLIHVYGE